MLQDTLATWLKWTTENPGPDGRLSGSVCGQDPRSVYITRTHAVNVEYCRPAEHTAVALGTKAKT